MSFQLHFLANYSADWCRYLKKFCKVQSLSISIGICGYHCKLLTNFIFCVDLFAPML
jgi:hypothetical protein